MSKTTAERQSSFRERLKKSGLKRFEIWLHPADWPRIKRAVADLNKLRRPRT